MDKLSFSIFIMFSVCDFNVLSIVNTYELLMPNIYSDRDNLFLCTDISIRDNFFLVGFKPKPSIHAVHHIILYGCSNSARPTNETAWNCGEMQTSRLYEEASTCLNGSQVVYVWARDVAYLHLPRDVGFRIGPDSPIKYLVMQVHYMHRFTKGSYDNTGLILKYTKQHMPRQAGVILLEATGVMPPRAVGHMEIACRLFENKTIHPFAFRTQAHNDIGYVVSGYVVRQGVYADSWSMIGKKDAQLPQMYHPVIDTYPVRSGDVLAARCTMKNIFYNVVRIGRKDRDAVCLFYIMYWVENDTPLETKICFSHGPPYYNWTQAIENFQHIPDTDASSL